jgi:DNA ligase-1
LSERKAKLAQLVPQLDDARLKLSPLLEYRTWEELGELRERARAQSVEGLMLKRRDSTYQVGRKKGDWWKWKIDPYTIDAVLLYAQPGSGRRANLYTDYTFALWRGEELVPVAKAYSGLTDSEINRVDNWIRRNTVERFGPVRSVKPELVFELAFENIALSKRHKSGVAVRFPRIKRWREDKPHREADTLDNLKSLIPDNATNSSAT